MKFVLIAVALLDDLRCGSKVGGAPRLGIGASGVGAVTVPDYPSVAGHLASEAQNHGSNLVMRRRLGRNHALDLAVAEIIAAPRCALGNSVAHERSRSRARG